LKGKSADYIKARFDSIVENLSRVDGAASLGSKILQIRKDANEKLDENAEVMVNTEVKLC
jgi:hypothetical protein